MNVYIRKHIHVATIDALNAAIEASPLLEIDRSDYVPMHEAMYWAIATLNVGERMRLAMRENALNSGVRL